MEISEGGPRRIFDATMVVELLGIAVEAGEIGRWKNLKDAKAVRSWVSEAFEAANLYQSETPVPEDRSLGEWTASQELEALGLW